VSSSTTATDLVTADSAEVRTACDQDTVSESELCLPFAMTSKYDMNCSSDDDIATDLDTADSTEAQTARDQDTVSESEIGLPVEMTYDALQNRSSDDATATDLVTADSTEAQTGYDQVTVSESDPCLPVLLTSIYDARSSDSVRDSSLQARTAEILELVAICDENGCIDQVSWLCFVHVSLPDSILNASLHRNGRRTRPKCFANFLAWTI
jgi:hypothetical protein